MYFGMSDPSMHTIDAAYEPEEYANFQDEFGNDRVPEVADQPYETEEYANLQDEFGNDRVPPAAQQLTVQRQWVRGEIPKAQQPQSGPEQEQPAKHSWKSGVIRDMGGRPSDNGSPDQAPAVDSNLSDEAMPPVSIPRGETLQPPPMQRDPKPEPKFDSRPNQPGNVASRPAPQRQPPPKYQPPKPGKGPDNSAQAERSTFKGHVVGKTNAGGLVLQSSTARPGEKDALIALPPSATAQVKNDPRTRNAIERSLDKGDQASPVELSNFKGKWSARDTSQDALRKDAIRKPKSIA